MIRVQHLVGVVLIALGALRLVADDKLISNSSNEAKVAITENRFFAKDNLQRSFLTVAASSSIEEEEEFWRRLHVMCVDRQVQWSGNVTAELRVLEHISVFVIELSVAPNFRIVRETKKRFMIAAFNTQTNIGEYFITEPMVTPCELIRVGRINHHFTSEIEIECDFLIGRRERATATIQFFSDRE